MATGKSGTFELDCTSSIWKVRVNWSETYDAGSNSSVVTVDSVQVKSSSWYGFTYYPDGCVKINGETVITMNSVLGTHNVSVWGTGTWYNIKPSGGTVATGSATVIHDADGKKNITIEVTKNKYSRCSFATVSGDGGSGWGVKNDQPETISLTDIPTYTLTINAATGSTITVNRTSSGYASTGNITNGTRLYYNDQLKITFAASTNYKLLTTKVNGAAFTSGNTHSVAANVTVATTAQVLASAVGATNADIGSVSTITVTKYNTGYYHSLEYSFGNLSGYITSSGGVSTTETKYKGTSVAFTIPDSFYAQIPNSKTGTCTITCYTYSSSSSTTVLGDAKTCTFTVTAEKSNCQPVIVATVEDTNVNTTALTGNSSVLIRYKSTAKCTISATPQKSSTISSIRIAGGTVTGTSDGAATIATKSYGNVEATSFSFSATDSRGHTTSVTKAPIMISYVKLTCNPTITRPSHTGSQMVMRLSGNCYRGSFGAYSNTLTISYRFKEKTDASYGSWITVPSTNYAFGTSTYSSSTFSLGDNFDYKKSYIFQVRAVDGANGVALTTVTQTIEVQRGIPVFDWGESDFEFHVPVKITDGTLKIGNTTISEEQLQSLLALIT